MPVSNQAELNFHSKKNTHNTGNKVTEEAIGRAKTVLVSGEGPATVTSIIAHTLKNKTSNRLIFSGSVKFEETVQKHLKNTVLPLVDDLLQLLNIPFQSYELSAVNIGAASSIDSGTIVEGFSVDISALLAMLSAGLEMPIRQNILFTGHISSPDGDIAQIKNIPAKAEAAVTDKNITSFVFPSLDKDISLKVLKPKEYETATAAIRSCRGRIKLIEVNNIADLLEKTLSPEAIVSASLNTGFFETSITVTESNHLKNAATFLTQNNNNRFWDSLEKELILKDVKKSHSILTKFSDYYVRNAKYPSRFGENLSGLVISLPVTVRQTPRLISLLPKEQYIKLIQYASESDHEDITHLHNALYGQVKKQPVITDSTLHTEPDSYETNDFLNYFLNQLNPETIEMQVTRVYDEARGRFVIDKITVENNNEFIDTLTAFYAHVCRHINSSKSHVSSAKMSDEIMNVLNKIFPGKKKYNEALAIAKYGTHGGMRYILDIITEHLKQAARDNHILKVFKETIDPLDYQLRVSLITKLLNREKFHLPEEITSQPPERFADDYEEIIKAYSQSMSNLTTIMRRL